MPDCASSPARLTRSDPAMRRNRPRLLMLAVAGILLLLQPAAAQVSSVHTVFVIVMSDQNWSAIQGSPDAPYINNTLLAQGALATQYFTPPGIPLALPNHLWLEAGTNLGVVNEAAPYVNHQTTGSHLTTLLMNAGIPWKSYHEDIGGTTCPVASQGHYSTSTNPFVYFDDVAAIPTSCLAHVRPYGELAADLAGNTAARYNFIKPNLCNSMHQACPSLNNAIRQGDNWLAQEVPKILASAAYQTGGALFITWDHPRDASEGPIGMIMLSPFGRHGYTNTIRYTHGSALRTFQQILGVTNYLGDAAAQVSLEDLFAMPSGDTTAVTLTWAPSPGATGYKVTRATAKTGPFATIASGVQGTTYVDRGLTSGTTFFYSVIAANGAGESAAPPPVSIKPIALPSPPTNLTAKQTP